jgi:hypothetical protein
VEQVGHSQDGGLIPNAQLAVFPGGDHFLLWTSSPDKVLSPVAALLDAPMPVAK